MLTDVGTASAAVLAAKDGNVVLSTPHGVTGRSSCHEPCFVDPSVVSSSASASVSLPPVSPADGHPASNAPVSTALPTGTAVPTAEMEKEAADGHPATEAPELSGIAAPTDTLSTTGQKRVDFPVTTGRFLEISQKSRISEKVRESSPASIHAESSSNASQEKSESHRQSYSTQSPNRMVLQRPAQRRSWSSTAREMEKKLWSSKLRHRHQRIWSRRS